MEKALKCQFEEWNGFKVVTLPLSEVWQSVYEAEMHNGMEFYGPLMKDIEENGLINPIIVVDSTFAELAQKKKQHNNVMRELPEGYEPNDRLYVVWGGSNRVAIANELGYTHIDCVVVPNGDYKLGYKLQGECRKGFTYLYSGKRTGPNEKVQSKRRKWGLKN